MGGHIPTEISQSVNPSIRLRLFLIQGAPSPDLWSWKRRVRGAEVSVSLQCRLVVAGLVLICLASGCSITRKSASVDSISRMPFFGMELAPKRREPAPETHRIRRDHAVPVDLEPAKLATKGKASSNEKAWWQRLPGVEKRTAISLPRTDVVATPSEGAKVSVEESPVEADVNDSPEFW